MCVTWCHRKKWLYWNHEHCSPFDCDVVRETHGNCETCRHHRETVCVLTNAPLPESGGCCHWNVTRQEGLHAVSRDMLGPLHVNDRNIGDALDRLDAPAQLIDGQWYVDPDDLGLPLVYGEGTEVEDESEYAPSPAVEFENFEW